MLRQLFMFVLMFGAFYGCSGDNVIVNKDRYFKVELPFEERDYEMLIKMSERFADERGLETAVNRFGEGKFSVLLYNDRINISALNGMRNGIVEVDAISRGNPTEHDQRLVEAYVDELRPLTDRARR